jgi:hypothetical protein
MNADGAGAPAQHGRAWLRREQVLTNPFMKTEDGLDLLRATIEVGRPRAVGAMLEERCA